MIKLSITKLIFIFLLLPISAMAAVPAWQMVPDESSISFTGTQNGAPTTGSFKKFTGEINFDPTQLNGSKVKIVIDTTSVSTTFKDFTSTLQSTDWFNVKLFTQATFEAAHFTKIADNKYSAEGTLTIRDKPQPVTLTFSAQELSKDKEKVTGSTTIKRTAFGIGQGEWADTDSVKDDVQVNFVITAVKK